MTWVFKNVLGHAAHFGHDHEAAAGQALGRSGVSVIGAA